jgi:hypothetical protein
MKVFNLFFLLARGTMQEKSNLQKLDNDTKAWGASHTKCEFFCPACNPPIRNPKWCLPNQIQFAKKPSSKLQPEKLSRQNLTRPKAVYCTHEMALSKKKKIQK